MRLRVDELEGAQLDCAVALAEGWEWDRTQDRQMKKRGIVHGCGYHNGNSFAICAPRPEAGMLVGYAPHWSPSTMWSVGGPILEREKISLQMGSRKAWVAYAGYYLMPYTGDTMLEAAMRAYVASVFGDTIDLPNTGDDDAE